MITVFHGSDSVKSRDAFLHAKSEYADASSFDGAKAMLADIRQEESGGLFDAEKRAIFIDELLSKKKVSKELEAICNFLREEKDVPVFIWESKELTPKQLEVLGKVIAKKFDIPKQLFTFLDSIRPGNKEEMVRLFHEVIATEAPELVVTMLTRQIRILMALREPSENKIDEVARLAPWQMGKLQKQAELFSIDKLRNMHHGLFEIDLAQKTGRSMQPLTVAVDTLLLNL